MRKEPQFANKFTPLLIGEPPGFKHLLCISEGVTTFNWVPQLA